MYIFSYGFTIMTYYGFAKSARAVRSGPTLCFYYSSDHSQIWV